jgi:hypothetical protein
MKDQVFFYDQDHQEILPLNPHKTGNVPSMKEVFAKQMLDDNANEDSFFMGI